MRKEIKIGPILTVFADERYVPNMLDAFQTDFEMGNHWLANEESNRFFRRYPTIAEMSRLIEKERDQLREENKKLQQQLDKQKESNNDSV